MSDLILRPRTPEDDPQIIRIYNAIDHDHAPTRLEDFRHRLETMPEQANFFMLVAERAGAVVGTMSLNRRVYTSEPDSYSCGVSVHPNHWGQGTGTALAQRCMQALESRSARRIHAYIREDLPHAEHFAGKYGFERTGYGDQVSLLDVHSANLDRCRRAAERVRQSGITISSLAELQPDEAMLRAICDMDNASTRAVPSSDEWREMPFDEWKKHSLEGPRFMAEAFFVALDGDRPVGMAVLDQRGDGWASNGYTGVHPEYHGRGIASALKLRTVEWAQAHGIERIITGNDVNNKSMLHINQEMGYQPLPAEVELIKRL